MKEYPRTLAAVEAVERSRWPLVEALLDEIEVGRDRVKKGEYERVEAFLTDNGYPSYSTGRIRQFHEVGAWIEGAGRSLSDFTKYPFERVIEAKKKARSDPDSALAILQETTSKRQIRPDKITPRQVREAVKVMSDEDVARIKDDVTEEKVKRTVYRDRAKPSFRNAQQTQAAKKASRMKANPHQAADSFIAMLGPARAKIRSVCQGYQDFLALVEDEEWREYARDRLVAFQTDVNLALGEVLEGSIDDALARLLEGEEVK